MAVVPCFEELFSNLISKLKDSGQVFEVSSNFGPQKTLEDMFHYLWTLEEAQSCLLPTLLQLKKSSEDADRFRMEGNKCYQKKCLDKALKLYNLSIMSAPHPKLLSSKGLEKHSANIVPEIEEYITEEQDYKSLALGYANRSAVFFELKEYERCIGDIDLAFHYGYPKLLHSKLAERKAKCQISLGNHKDANQTLLDAMKTLNDLNLDESKTKSSREALQKLHIMCDLNENSKESLVKINRNSDYSILTDASKDELLFAYQTPQAPVLSQSNSTIPCLSSAVKLAFSPSQGRYLVAERDISPGEVLVVEKAYGHALHLDSSLRTHCSSCLSRCLSPLPCPSCPKVVFCSISCRNKSLVSHHSQECNILPTLAALDMGKNAVLAYRILSQIPSLELKSLISLYKQETIEYSPEMLGFNNKETPVYDSSDYRTIFHLVSNKSQRSVSDLFKRCAMAVVLTWLLRESHSYFVDSFGDPFDPSDDELTLVGCVLFTHLMNFPCNAHSITELQVDVSSFQKSSSQEIGSGAFGVLSLTNHSCNPSAARFSYGSTVVLRAIRFIAKGLEVTDSYGEHYGLQATPERKSALQQQYYFTCSCEACENNWPSYLNLPSKHKLKCLSCCRKLNSKGWCTSCKMTFTDSLAKMEMTCRGLETQKDIEKEIEQGIQSYENAYEDILKGNISLANGNSICNVIRLIDKYVDQPYKTYFEAQETLKHFYERQASCVFRKET